ncbi:MAG: DUF4230 domain-containing protein [Christensenellales bacterium]
MADNKMTDKSLKEKVLDNRLVRSIITVVAVMCVAFIILLVKINIDNKDARSSVVTEDFISGQLQELNELATSKVIYDGVVEMEDDSGIFKKKFYVKYTGEVKSYVDMSKADIKIDDRKRKISITLPHATVGEPNIGNNYQFYDTSWIKSDSLEAGTKALVRAEEDCKKKIDEKTMIEMADGYAKEAVENLLSSFKDISEPYTFEVKFE